MVFTEQLHRVSCIKKKKKNLSKESLNRSRRLGVCVLERGGQWLHTTQINPFFSPSACTDLSVGHVLKADLHVVYLGHFY